MKKLSEVNLHESVIVQQMHCDANIQKRLRSLGMTQNTRIEVLHKKKNGTCVIFLRGTRFALGSAICRQIEVSA